MRSPILWPNSRMDPLELDRLEEDEEEDEEEDFFESELAFIMMKMIDIINNKIEAINEMPKNTILGQKTSIRLSKPTCNRTESDSQTFVACFCSRMQNRFEPNRPEPSVESLPPIRREHEDETARRRVRRSLKQIEKKDGNAQVHQINFVPKQD